MICLDTSTPEHSHGTVTFSLSGVDEYGDDVRVEIELPAWMSDMISAADEIESCVVVEDGHAWIDALDIVFYG